MNDAGRPGPLPGRPLPAPLRLAVLLSGGGRTLQNLADQIRGGELPAVIAGVVSSHADARGLQRAERLDLPHQVVDFREVHGDEFSSSVTRAVDDISPDLVVLAGFVRKWKFPERFRWRVLNVHPALLPAFGGKGFFGSRVHRAVVGSGARFSGCTVHFADLEYDTGPIVLQRVIPVLPDDTPETLGDRVFSQECIAYPEAIRLFAEGRLEIRDPGVTIRTPW